VASPKPIEMVNHPYNSAALPRSLCDTSVNNNNNMGDPRVDQSKTVEVRIVQFSPQSSPIPLVFAL